MAGLSHAILVIEAERKSGTLITARLATDYNRDVFTVPGNIFSSASAGPHYLIRNGATPITSPEDLIDALGFAKKENAEKEARDYTDCSGNELKILSLLSEPLSRDDIVRNSGLSVTDANVTLGTLEVKGYVAEEMGEFRLS